MNLKIDKNISVYGKHGLPIIADFIFVDNELKLPIVIFCHGYKGFKDWGAWPLMCKSIAKQGYFVVAINFSHNGGTQENPIDFPNLEAFGNDNFSKQQDDLQSIIDTITNQKFAYSSNIDVSNVTLIGHSRGGGAAIIKAANEAKVSKLITLAAISTYETSFPKGKILENWKKKGVWYIKNGRTGQEMPHYIQFYEDYQSNKSLLDISEFTKKLRVPHLIIHGTDDTSVVIQNAEKLKRLNPKAVTFFLQTNHVFGAKHPWELTVMPSDLKLVTQQIISFLEQ